MTKEKQHELSIRLSRWAQDFRVTARVLSELPNKLIEYNHLKGVADGLEIAAKHVYEAEQARAYSECGNNEKAAT